ncbi:leucine-rich repeat domain-containing protein [Streptomyces prasinus]|uniref:hypothetical protein n=1 Tax=Streptomyces prasinus TaxID=67345 RepID=UPI0036C17DC5
MTLTDDGEAMALAARFAPAADFSAKALVKLWPKAEDPDAFAAALLAPALRREGTGSLRPRRVTSLTGLRHLTMLDALSLIECKEVTDFDEVGALTGLTSLHLDNRTGVDDLTPLRALTGLTHLVPYRCRAVEDVAPLLPLSRRVRLDIDTSRISSVAGFGAAFPTPETLSLRGNTRLQDVAQLSGLRRLTALDLGNTGIHDLAGLLDMPSLQRALLPSRLFTAASDGSADPVVAELRARGVTAF